MENIYLSFLISAAKPWATKALDVGHSLQNLCVGCLLFADPFSTLLYPAGGPQSLTDLDCVNGLPHFQCRTGKAQAGERRAEEE